MSVMISDVWAVVVTYNRRDLLARCLETIFNQTRPPGRVLVVDNASTDGTEDFLRKKGWFRRSDFVFLRLDRNVGGAGGFSAGLRYASEHGAKWFWLMDDDGYPDGDCLETLFNYLCARGLDAISPLQVDIDDFSRPAFPTKDPRGGFISSVSKFVAVEDVFCSGEANLFNGVLLSLKSFEQVGFPRDELFIRGDEVDYLKRMRKSGLRFGTLLSSRFFHPSDFHERIPVLFGLNMIRDAGNPFKNYYLFRNRARAFVEDGYWFLVLIDFFRYVYYFLFFKKGDFWGLISWVRATWDGVLGKMGRHRDF